MSSRRGRPGRIMAILLTAGLQACGGGDSTSPQANISITTDRSSVSLTGVGVTTGVQATVTGGNAAVVWRSSDENVVRVTASGAAAALVSYGPGSATVTATAGEATASVSVTVTADVRSITTNQSVVAVTVDDERTATLTAASEADPGVLVTYTWATSNAQVATVTASSSNGASATITAVGIGTASITVTARSQFGATRTATVSVSSTLAVPGVFLSEDKTDVGVGRSVNLAVRVTGGPDFPKIVTWSSTNTAVVTVGFTGRVSAEAPGTATVHVRSTADPAIRDSVVIQATATPYALADFALIPAGTFRMGTAIVADQPEHLVTLTRPFLIQRTEVTQSQWQSVMGNNPSYNQQCGGDCPIEQVSWNEVEIFISRLNAASPGITYRLPTEAEWEYAARAGSAGPWHGPIDSIAWMGRNALGRTHPVGQKKPNAWGLFDVIGNVGEWIQDFYGPLSTEAVTDPTGAASGTFRVIRGNNYLTAIDLTRPHSNRGGGLPNSSATYTGFRLARAP